MDAFQRRSSSGNQAHGSGNFSHGRGRRFGRGGGGGRKEHFARKAEAHAKRTAQDEKKHDEKKTVKEHAEIVRLDYQVQNGDPDKMDTFSDYPISEYMKKGLRDCKYTIPTPIQHQTIIHSLKGADILAAAKTGSGKTLAFVVPLLENLYRHKWTQWDGLGALVITPTRELAYQIFEVLNRLGRHHDLSAGLVIGGKDLKFETDRLHRCNIIICTPGRLLQHMDENPVFQWENLRMLVLDEADRILDMGFAKTMNAILQNLPSREDNGRQTLLFSATQTKSVKDLARLSLNNPTYVSVDENAKHATPDELVQSYVVCPVDDKLNFLWSFIKSHLKQKILVFMSSCKQVKFAYELFCYLRPGISLLALYGTLHQLRRMAIYDDFCNKQSAVLFSTDIASRGLDFPAVNWVVQLDCPENCSTYIHRAGRTARYTKGGQALLVLLPSEEESMIAQLEQRKVPITKIQVNPQKLHSIQRKADALLARDMELKETAQRAFKSYIKSIHLMRDKTIFSTKDFDFDGYARSLGLAITPRVRFLDNKKDKPKTESTPASDSLKPEAKKVTSLTANSGDDDESDDDILTVKAIHNVDDRPAKKQMPKDDKDGGELLEQPQGRNKKQPVVTKATLAKRALKKGIALNSKVTFDEDDEDYEDIDDGEEGLKEPKKKLPTDQISRKVVSEKAKLLAERKESGIDINLLKEIMREEDKIDKEVYRKMRKEQRQEAKMKLKEKMRERLGLPSRSQGDDDEEDEEGDDERDRELDALIDSLPDPDKFKSSRNDDNEEDSDSEGDGGPSKRFKPNNEYDEEDYDEDQGSEEESDGDEQPSDDEKEDQNELEDDERLAAMLLGNR